jgi:hypothetical protein
LDNLRDRTEENKRERHGRRAEELRKIERELRGPEGRTVGPIGNPDEFFRNFEDRTKAGAAELRQRRADEAAARSARRIEELKKIERELQGPEGRTVGPIGNAAMVGAAEGRQHRNEVTVSRPEQALTAAYFALPPEPITGGIAIRAKLPDGRCVVRKFSPHNQGGVISI